MPLRSDLLRGDLRCLYLGWLRCAQDGGPGEVKPEPPVPAGLKELSGPLYALIEFLEIDRDLVEIAAQASKPLAAGPTRREIVRMDLQPAGKTRTRCSYHRSRSRGERGETFHTAFSGVEPMPKLPTGPLQRTASQAIFWQRPLHAKERAGTAERAAYSGSGKTKSGRRGKPDSVSRSVARRDRNLETGRSKSKTAAQRFG
jgi:hypothetical protein